MNSILMDNHFFGFAAVVLYASSAYLLYRAVFAETQPSYTDQKSGSLSIIWMIALAAAALHGWMLINSTFKSTGLNLAFFNSLSITAWFAVMITLLLNVGRPVINLGLILFPMTAMTLLVSIFFTNPGISTIEPKVQWHVLISVIAYALLTIAAGQSVLVSLQDKRLHSHRPGGFLRALPPLAVMETVLFQLLVATFLMLTLALITGFVFLDDVFAQRLVHKTTLSIVAWLLLAVLLTGQWRWGWRGQKAAGMTIGAFLSLLLGYFGSKFVIELILA